MSTKFIVLFSCLFLISSAHNGHTYFSSGSTAVDESDEGDEAMAQMKALGGFFETNKLWEFEALQPNPPVRTQELTVQKAIDEIELLMPLVAPDAIIRELEDEVLTDSLAKKLVFAPRQMITELSAAATQAVKALKDESMIEKVARSLDNYFWQEEMD